MVALTISLNDSYGSRLVVSGAGFLLNSEMDDFSLKPGHANLWGLVGAEANQIEPGKRMLSSMSPTLVLRRGRPFLILGSPGGSKIITAVSQALINHTRFGLTLEETVALPRFHHQWLPDQVYLEQGGFSESLRQALTDLGHTIKERTLYGSLQMIRIDSHGMMAAAADPRRHGKASGY
jgi:gamma-glutamyltranspeptidase/glutathione hydrolase